MSATSSRHDPPGDTVGRRVDAASVPSATMQPMVGERIRVAILAAATAVALGGSAVTATPVDAAAPTAPVPAIFAVGSRLTWSSGDATLEGAKLVPDPDGWLWRDGQWFRVESTGGNGGVGY